MEELGRRPCASEAAVSLAGQQLVVSSNALRPDLVDAAQG